MRSILAAVAVFVVVGAALPAAASDVTSDRDSTYRNVPSVHRSPGSSTATESAKAAESNKAPCSCAGARGDAHREPERAKTDHP
jgi:hypothetical protein